MTPGWFYPEFWASKQPLQTMTWYAGNKQSRGKACQFNRCEPILFFGKPLRKYDSDYFAVSTTRDTVGDEKLGNLHPCAKPRALIMKLMKPQVEKGGILYDAFLGSGSSLLAAEDTNRTCYGMEIIPKYVQLAITRWELETGKKRVLCRTV